MSSSKTSSTPPSTRARAALWIVMSLVVAHSAAVALWVSPNNVLKDTVGFTRLRSYILPMFDQAWSVFAPEADNGYDLFEIRATIKDGSRRQAVTAWMKVSAREVGPQLRYHPFPTRTVLITDRLANNQLLLFGGLSDAEKLIVHNAGADVTESQQADRIYAAATNDNERAAATAYSNNEAAVERYLSGIAEAVWGTNVATIQFRQNQVYAPTYQTAQGQRQLATGYLFVSQVRPAARLSADELEVFRGYVQKVGIR